jgi:hypothetical protein
MKNESRTYHMTHCHLCFRNWPYFSLVFVFHKPKSNLSPISFLKTFSCIIFLGFYIHEILFSFLFVFVPLHPQNMFSFLLFLLPNQNIVYCCLNSETFCHLNLNQKFGLSSTVLERDDCQLSDFYKALSFG